MVLIADTAINGCPCLPLYAMVENSGRLNYNYLMDNNVCKSLISDAIDGDTSALAELFEHYRPRLERMVALRIDTRLTGRIDSADVLQDSFIDISKQVQSYSKENRLPFFLWMRLITGQRLSKTQRDYLGTQKRDVRRELTFSNQSPDASSFNLASHLVGSFTTASKHVAREEIRRKVQQALKEMEPHDREVIALRNFEQMSIRESALVLGVSETSASSRYRRAILRIKKALENVPGLLDDSAGRITR